MEDRRLDEINESHAKGNGFHRLALEAHGYRWYRVGAEDHVARQRKM